MADTVLIAEDDAALRPILELLCEDAGYDVLIAEDGAAALQLYRDAAKRGEAPAVVISDINMPGLDGLELIDRLHEEDAALPVIFVTAYSSVDSAVAALRKGAFDYLTKPFRNERLLKVVKNALRQRSLARENESLRRQVRQASGTSGLLHADVAMEPIERIIRRAAPSSASILIRGESGTGKEVVARAIHEGSPRAKGPFISINCAAIAEGLLESELFGHEKGAFSGATSSAKGLFRAADGGTLFLDEIGEMPPGVQTHLLRVLESHEVRPVGSTKTIPVDVRIVAATLQNLDALIADKRFREDLYYRLAVIEMEIPPLRHRPEDIPLLAQHFLQIHSREEGESGRSLAPETMEILTSYAFPGNVRELRNLIQRCLILGGETITPEDLPPKVRGEPDVVPGARLTPLEMSLTELEKHHVRAVLRDCGGERKAASERLGIDLSTLYRKLKRWAREDGVEDEEGEG